MDINQDNSRKFRVSDDCVDSSEQFAQTSAITCGSGQDTQRKEDLCSQIRDHNEMDPKGLTDRSPNTCKPETSEKDACSSTGEFGQSKSFVGNPYEKGDDKKDSPKAAEKVYSKISPRSILSDPKTEEPEEDASRRYERNLKKFLEDKVTMKETSSRGETKVTERVIKSDGELAGIIDYCGNVTKISSILSKVNLKRSSAPATCEKVSGQNLETKEDLATSTEFPLENYKTPVSIRTGENPLSINPSDDSMSIALRYFKMPIIIPPIATTPVSGFSESSFSSPGPSRIQDSPSSTPVLRRPTDINFKPRKAYYTFSPEDSGVLRQSQSLPDISRHQRREEKQRRSLVSLDDRCRIARSLFQDKPEPSTPENRQSTVPKRHIKYSTGASSSDQLLLESSKEKAALAKEDADRKAKICRKLTFGAPTSSKIEEVQPAKPVEAQREKPDSPQKRKKISPAVVECSSTPVKKVRISPECNTMDRSSEMGVNINPASEKESKVSGKTFKSPSEQKASPVKRKAQETEDSPSSKKK